MKEHGSRLPKRWSDRLFVIAGSLVTVPGILTTAWGASQTNHVQDLYSSSDYSCDERSADPTCQAEYTDAERADKAGWQIALNGVSLVIWGGAGIATGYGRNHSYITPSKPTDLPKVNFTEDGAAFDAAYALLVAQETGDPRDLPEGIRRELPPRS